MAMTINVELNGERRVSDAELAAILEPAMKNLMRACLVRAKRLVPKKTWALHDSLAEDVTREGATVVGTLSAGSPEVDYARHVELGTSKARAQPYLRPAVLQSRAADLKGGA